MNAPTNQAASIYCDLMEESKSRIALLQRITAGSLGHGTENFEYECASLQLRNNALITSINTTFSTTASNQYLRPNALLQGRLFKIGGQLEF